MKTLKLFNLVLCACFIFSCTDSKNENSSVLYSGGDIITMQNSEAEYVEALVLDKGEIIEEGTHEELIDLDKIYKQMWEKQKKIN